MAEPPVVCSLDKLPEWISEKIRTNDVTGCWEWLGSFEQGKYGQLRIFGRNIKAHRAVFELLVGPVPEKLELDHLCRVHWCVNPAHLEAVTSNENHLRGNRYYKRLRSDRPNSAVRFVPRHLLTPVPLDVDVFAEHVLTVVGDAAAAHTATVHDELRTRWPESYDDLSQKRFWQALRMLGVEPRQIRLLDPDGSIVHKRGFIKDDVVDGLKRRNEA